MRCSPPSARAWAAAKGAVYRRLRSAGRVLRYMSQHHLLDSDIHLASFDDHYLYDSLSLRIDTVQQDNRQLAWHCYDLISQLIDGNTPEPLQRYLPATLQFRHR
jgi:LacI family sucrose operon transcriptional repressor